MDSSDGVLCIAVWFIMQETRGSIILTRLARKTRKETGNNRYRARAEDETASLKTMIWISSTRPFCELSKSHPLRVIIVSGCRSWCTDADQLDDICCFSLSVDLLISEPIVAACSVCCSKSMVVFPVDSGSSSYLSRSSGLASHGAFSMS